MSRLRNIKSPAASLLAALFFCHTLTAADLSTIKVAAEAGDPEGQKQLGDAFLMRSDSAQAQTWYLKAAEQGHAPAQAQLAKLLLDRARMSLSLKPDAREANGREAFKWAGLAANAGDRSGQANLASIYFEGKYVPQDLVQAYKWAELGSRGVSTEGIFARSQAQSTLNAAILKMTPEQILEGKRLALEFRPRPGQQIEMPPSPPPQWLSSLKLQGISGLPGKRLAIINGKTFGDGESGAVRIGQETVALTVTSLTQNSATVLVREQTAITLQLAR
jgi:hypothetical protein